MTRGYLVARALALAAGGIGTIIFLSQLDTRFAVSRLPEGTTAIDIVAGTIRIATLCAAGYVVAVAVAAIIASSPGASVARRVVRRWTISPLRRIVSVACGAVVVLAFPVTTSPAVESTPLILDDSPVERSVEPGLPSDETATFSIVSDPPLSLAPPARAVTPPIRSVDDPVRCCESSAVPPRPSETPADPAPHPAAHR